MTTPEGKVKKAIRKEFDTVGAWTFCPVQTGMGKAGVPDFLACVPYTIRASDVGLKVGLFVAVEAKHGPAEPTDRQREQLRQLTDAGAIVMVVNEDSLARLNQFLDGCTEPPAIL